MSIGVQIVNIAANNINLKWCELHSGPQPSARPLCASSIGSIHISMALAGGLRSQWSARTHWHSLTLALFKIDLSHQWREGKYLHLLLCIFHNRLNSDKTNRINNAPRSIWSRIEPVCLATLLSGVVALGLSLCFGSRSPLGLPRSLPMQMASHCATRASCNVLHTERF